MHRPPAAKRTFDNPDLSVGGLLVNTILFAAYLIGIKAMCEAIDHQESDLKVLEESMAIIAALLAFLLVVGAAGYAINRYIAHHSTVDDSTFNISRFEPNTVRTMLYLSAFGQLVAIAGISNAADPSDEEIAISVGLSGLFWAFCILLFEYFLAPRTKADCYRIQSAANETILTELHLADRGYGANALLGITGNMHTMQLSDDDRRCVYADSSREKRHSVTAREQFDDIMAICHNWTLGQLDDGYAQRPNFTHNFAADLLSRGVDEARFKKITGYIEGILAASLDWSAERKQGVLKSIKMCLEETQPGLIQFSLFKIFVSTRANTVSEKLLSHFLKRVAKAHVRLSKDHPVTYREAARGYAVERLTTEYFPEDVGGEFRQQPEDTSFSREKELAFHRLSSGFSAEIRGRDFVYDLTHELSDLLYDYMGKLSIDNHYLRDTAAAETLSERLEIYTGQNLGQWTAALHVPSAHPRVPTSQSDQAQNDDHAELLLRQMEQEIPYHDFAGCRASKSGRQPEQITDLTRSQFSRLFRDIWNPRISQSLVQQGVITEPMRRPQARSQDSGEFTLARILAEAVSRVQTCAGRDHSAGPGEGQPHYWDELGLLLHYLTGKTLDVEGCVNVTQAVTNSATGPDSWVTQVRIVPPGAQPRTRGDTPYAWAEAIKEHMETVEPDESKRHDLVHDCINRLTLGERLPEKLRPSASAATATFD